MRFVIYGAGAVGGTIGGRLHQHSNDVVLIARGAHGEALRTDGLLLRSAGGDDRLHIPTVTHPSQLAPSADDVVVLTMKSQHTVAALEDLVAAGHRPPVVCGQNGVSNEREALRRFPDVYGMCIQLPATHLEPGVVIAHSHPVAGALDVGRYPGGVDATAEGIAAALSASGFTSEPDPDVMSLKYAKLLRNLANSLDAACGRASRGSDLAPAGREEARSVLEAAGISWTPSDRYAARSAGVRIDPVGGQPHLGSSSWQSLARGSGSIEADHLNGEIVLLGRLHGIPTPVNCLLQEIANELAYHGRPPGSMTLDEIEARLPEPSATT